MLIPQPIHYKPTNLTNYIKNETTTQSFVFLKCCWSVAQETGTENCDILLIICPLLLLLLFFLMVWKMVLGYKGLWTSHGTMDLDAVAY